MVRESHNPRNQTHQPFHGAFEKQPPVPRAALMEELVMVAKFDP